MKDWTSAEIPDQHGKIILITGANSGLGLEAANVLSAKNAHVVMAVRNLQKGEQAMNEIKKSNPSAQLTLMHLDLADLNSIREFSDAFRVSFSQLHVLMNNAGVMYPKSREVTKQNFEIQFGTNHLGHFALTGLLLDILKKTPHSRVVTQSSVMHKVRADIHFDDLNFEKSYNKGKAYAQSKLANLLFTYELDRQLKAHKLAIVSLAAHPGYTDTNLQNNSGIVVSMMNKLLAQKVEMGALPILRAATEETVKGGEYFGPTKMKELRGYPELVKSSDKSYDRVLAKKLWEVSEKLTSVTFSF